MELITFKSDFNDFSKTSLSLEEVKKLINDPLQQQSVLSYIYDVISDYFCGTVRRDVKDCLQHIGAYCTTTPFTYYGEQLTKKESAVLAFTSLIMLENLAGVNFKSCFSLIENKTKDCATLEIKNYAGEELISFDLEEISFTSINEIFLKHRDPTDRIEEIYGLLDD